MADFKTLLQLTNEARVKDQPFIDTITPALMTAIESAMTTEIEYRVEYDINAQLLGTDGPLQKTRIQNYFLDTLRAKAYRAVISTTELSPVDEMLVITWKVATLSTSL